MSLSITHLNGQNATAEALAPLVFAGYAHFTAMQVRDRAVRGLDLHLDRLHRASDELFGQHLSDTALRRFVRAALEDAPADVSLTLFVTSQPGEFTPSDSRLRLDVLIKVTDPAHGPIGPLTLDMVEYERHLPGVKHVGEVAKTLYLRRANSRGFDDAAFQDTAGRLTEATIWNLAFWDGKSVIWPQADILPGVTMQILTRQLRAVGVPLQTREIRSPDLARGLSAVVMNSWTPGIPLTRIGDHRLACDPAFADLLHEAYHAEAPLHP